jgi:hypothetical protein
MFGRPVRAIKRDNVTIYFNDPTHGVANDAIDRELAAMEARSGQG